MKSSLGLSSDDFMKLFVAQLQNQDPLQPQDPGQMLDQLSQMTMVEESYNNNTALSSLLAAQNNTATMNSFSFIGTNVIANGNAVAFDGTNQASLHYNLSVPTTSSTVTISDASGNVVKTAALGAQSAGNLTYAWDGTGTNGNLLPAGSYTFAIKSTSASGAAVAATTYTTGLVTGVDMSGATPMLNIGGASVALTDVIGVQG